MPKRPSADPQPTAPRSGPPPLRRQEPKRDPKPRRRANLKEVWRALLHPSIHTLRNDLGHYLQYGLWAFVAIFLVGALYWFGNPPERENQSTGDVDYKVIAKVGRTKLLRAAFEEQLRPMGIYRDELLTMRFQQIGSMYDRWVDQRLIAREAGRRGLKVSGQELNEELTKRTADQLKQQRGTLSERDWKYRLSQEGKSYQDLERETREGLDQDEVRSFLLEKKLRKAIEDEVKVADQDLSEKYDEVSGHVILVQASTSKPPPPPKDAKESPEDAKRRADQQQQYEKALEAAKPQAEQVLAKARAAGANFEELAKKESKDYTASSGGKFGPAARDAYDITRFGDDYKKAIFELPVGQVSALIKADQGWVIAKVTAKKKWPDDFDDPDPRSLDDAKKIADQIHADLVKGADFAAVAKEKSEDPGSKDKGGEYDLTGRGMWVKPFEKMAFALQDKELSKPFKTQFGYHIMQVMQRELPKAGETVEEPDTSAMDELKSPEEKAKEEAELKALPLPNHQGLAKAKRVKVRHILIKGEDPKQKLEDKRKQLLSEKQSKHYDEVLKKLRDDAYASGLVTAFDPIIKAYLASKDNQRDEQVFWLRVAAAAWPDAKPEVHYELGKLYEQQGSLGSTSALKVAAAKALARYPAAQVAPELLKALDTFEPDVRQAIINSLGDLKAKDATAKLQSIVSGDPDDTVAKAAEEALKKIGATVPKRVRTSPLPPPNVGATTPPAPPAGLPTPAPVTP